MKRTNIGIAALLMALTFFTLYEGLNRAMETTCWAADTDEQTAEQAEQTTEQTVEQAANQTAQTAEPTIEETTEVASKAQETPAETATSEAGEKKGLLEKAKGLFHRSKDKTEAEETPESQEAQADANEQPELGKPEAETSPETPDAKTAPEVPDAQITSETTETPETRGSDETLKTETPKEKKSFAQKAKDLIRSKDKSEAEETPESPETPEEANVQTESEETEAKTEPEIKTEPETSEAPKTSGDAGEQKGEETSGKKWKWFRRKPKTKDPNTNKESSWVKTATDMAMWKNLDSHEGWLLQQSRISNKCRILNPKGETTAEGEEETLRNDFEKLKNPWIFWIKFGEKIGVVFVVLFTVLWVIVRAYDAYDDFRMMTTRICRMFAQSPKQTTPSSAEKLAESESPQNDSDQQNRPEQPE